MASFPFYTLIIAAALFTPVFGITCLVGNKQHAVMQGDYKWCVTVKDKQINKEVYYGTNDDVDLSQGICKTEMVEKTPLEYCFCKRNECNDVIRWVPYLDIKRTIIKVEQAVIPL
ncbi:hypothetical protein CAEBREN_00084 [Caenorhabditis brenneri]|uniref:Uncharacterized protein n=1 Tax=Caenorhabditis brenneri TaxID=135651 RepID=G0PBK0_CAEBE|nr:hypothetical protein CAEBREN_00084 [Caenorhabditis brenneri]